MEFALVTPLVLVVALAVIQLALTMFVRATITSAAAEGARVAALSGSSNIAGVKRTRNILTASIANDVIENVSARQTVVSGTRVMEVTVDARLPLIGLYGPTTMELTGHAVRED